MAEKWPSTFSIKNDKARKSLIEMVASLGIEPRTQGFSVLCSTN